MNSTPSDLEEDTTDIPVENPFSRFAFKPTDSRTQSSKGEKTGTSPIVYAFPGKRKGPEDVREDSPSTKKGRTKLVKASSNSNATGSASTTKVKLYDHLNTIPDHLNVGLNIVFCGINPGQQSAEIGHHYGNPNNHFWSCLHESGLTSRRLDPREDHLLLKQFSIGLTNLVDRPTVQQNELSRQEQVAAVPSLLEKLSRFRPRVVCFVGLGIAEIVNSSVSYGDSSNLVGKKTRSEKTAVGLQTYKMVHDEAACIREHSETLFFAVSSTSGRVVRYQKTDKVQQFKDLHDLSLKLKEGSIDTSSLKPIILPSSVKTNTEGQSSIVPSGVASTYVKSLGSSNVGGGSDGSRDFSPSFDFQKSIP